MLAAEKASISKLFLVFVIGILLFPCFVGCSAGSPEVTATPTLCVVPIGGEQKEAVTIYGSGFAPGEIIRLELKNEGFTWQLAPKETMGVNTANEWGAFKFKDKFPAVKETVKPGVYTLVAYGDKGSVATSPYELLKKE